MFGSLFTWIREQFADAAYNGLKDGCKKFVADTQQPPAIEVEARPQIPAESNGRRLKARA